ncbi:MAG: Rrf2 family transcriptional regulator [Bacteroidetes bacterium]|jgi:Rrf2 family protein|nr:Rrf2 family transcriptional regulator [Bacteroidota bacterium]
MWSTGCTYGIQAALFLAVRDAKAYVPIRQISDHLGVSFHFLTKVLQVLNHHGVLRSQRGPHGGVALARTADAISLRDLIVAVDGPGLFEDCVLGLPGCGDQKPCPIHDHWADVRGCFDQHLAATTLAELARNPDWLALWQITATEDDDFA